MTKKEEITYLIKKGFSLEIISFELKVPIDELVVYKKQLEMVNNIKSPLDRMRMKYQELYFQSNKKEEKGGHEKELTPEQLKLIKDTIQKIEDIIPPSSNGEIGDKIKKIYSELRKIEDYTLPLEYSKRLYMLVQAQKKSKGMPRELIQEIVNKLAKSIKHELNRTEDIGELKELSRQVTIAMVTENPIPLTSVKNQISNKISACMQKKAYTIAEVSEPQYIIQIAQDILSGNIDIKKTKMTIKQEAEVRTKKHTGKIKMSQGQEEIYIKNKILQIIISKSGQIPIQSPEKAVLQLQELYEGNIVLATETVIKSLIKSGQFETAEKICSKYIKESKKEESIQIRNLRRLIRNARISKLINDLLKNKIPKDQEQKYFERIQKAIETEAIIPSQIILGKSQDGLRNITLKDIWEKQRNK